MKKLLISLLLLTLTSPLVAAFSNTYGDSNSYCGHWDDVDPELKYHFTVVCNTGYLHGLSLKTFGLNEMSRAEAAVIANRIIYGSEEYENIEYKSSQHNALTHIYSDTPTDKWSNEWMIKAMYYATINEIMSGDDDADTFRPTDTISYAEFMKVLWMAAHQSELLLGDDAIRKNFNTTDYPWYSDMAFIYSEHKAIDGFSVSDGQARNYFLLDVSTEPFVSEEAFQLNLGFNEPALREKAALLIFEMVYRRILNPAS